MNQITAETQTSAWSNLASLALSPITGPVRYLSAIRGFLLEMPHHLSYFQTQGLFHQNEIHYLGPSWKVPERIVEAPEGINRHHYFLVNERRHLGLTEKGLVVISETQTTSSKGNAPTTPTFSVIGAPNRRDVFNLARLTSYEEVKQLASEEIFRRMAEKKSDKSKSLTQ